MSKQTRASFNCIEKAILKRIKLSLDGIKKDDLFNPSDKVVKNAVWKHAEKEGVGQKIFGDQNGDYGKQPGVYWQWYGLTV